MNINTETGIYGVFGNPVAHSLSPVMHNRAFASCDLNNVYLAFHVTDIKTAIQGIRALNIRGVSITIPHKIRVMEYLDEIDRNALKIGAVNTIVNRKGKLYGYNSDGIGALKALRQTTPIKNRRIALIGAGGAARAIADAVTTARAHLTILNRTPSKGKALAKDFNARFLPLTEIYREKFDILINTTPLGMTPDIHRMPVPADILSSEMIVMDIVYHPLQTKLLLEAEKKGCQTVDGLAMFVYQGAVQFELWTEQEAPVHLMRDTVEKALRT
jgi:shikimate dehydrogenase